MYRINKEVQHKTVYQPWKETHLGVVYQNKQEVHLW